MNNLTSRSVMINDDTLIFFIFWFPNIKEPDITNDANKIETDTPRKITFICASWI